MSGITTHILDLTHGHPAANVLVKLYLFEPLTAEWELLKTTVTNSDGRLDTPLLSSDRLKIGTYKLVFYIGDYFQSMEAQLPDPPFLNQIPVIFGLADDKTPCHVPILISPWGYQVYRGS